ncbi:MAG: leucine-rich repeat domain-containing protein [Paludibacteraceae bacterium]|nr:leucine-rich repeat domain-containing protein [Paludibacteraceae bacterium]
MEDNAFFNCTALTSIEIPSSVTKIVNFAFWFCDNLKTAKVPETCELEEESFPSTTEIIRY